MRCLGNFNEENMGDLLDLLSDYHCRKKPTADSLKDILLELAHQELVQKPRYITNCFQEILSPKTVRVKSLDSLKNTYMTRMPSSKKVTKMIKVPEELKPEEQDTISHLHRYLKTLNRTSLEKFLIFVTAGDLLPEEININFTEQIPRAPHASTCSNTLVLNTNYACYNELASEFNDDLNDPETFRFYLI